MPPHARTHHTPPHVLAQDPRLRANLRAVAEAAKMRLSSEERVVIRMPVGGGVEAVLTRQVRGAWGRAVGVRRGFGDTAQAPWRFWDAIGAVGPNFCTPWGVGAAVVGAPGALPPILFAALFSRGCFSVPWALHTSFLALL